MGRCLGRNPPSVLGGIHLVGIPAPRAEFHWRLLSLSQRGRVISPSPPASSTQAHHPPRQGGGFLSAPKPGLSADTSRCHASATWMEFPQAHQSREPGAAHQLANPASGVLYVSLILVLCINVGSTLDSNTSTSPPPGDVGCREHRDCRQSGNNYPEY